MTDPQEAVTEVVTQAEVVTIDVRQERVVFEKWWRTWCPDRDFPAASSHIFDAWLASARHRRLATEAVEAKNTRLREANELREAALGDCQYVAGVGAGWNAAQDPNPEAALAALLRSREGRISALREARAALTKGAA